MPSRPVRTLAHLPLALIVALSLSSCSQGSSPEAAPSPSSDHAHAPGTGEHAHDLPPDEAVNNPQPSADPVASVSPGDATEFGPIVSPATAYLRPVISPSGAPSPPPGDLRLGLDRVQVLTGNPAQEAAKKADKPLVGGSFVHNTYVSLLVAPLAPTLTLTPGPKLSAAGVDGGKLSGAERAAVLAWVVANPASDLAFTVVFDNSGRVSALSEITLG